MAILSVEKKKKEKKKRMRMRRSGNWDEEGEQRERESPAGMAMTLTFVKQTARRGSLEVLTRMNDINGLQFPPSKHLNFAPEVERKQPLSGKS